MILRILVAIVLLAAVAFTIRLWMEGNRSTEMNPKLGVTDGQLSSCPDKPNCVSTFANPANKAHFMAPLEATSNPLSRVEEVCTEQGLKLVKKDDNYARFEFKSQLFGFVDDIEFLYDESNKKLHFRSASRVGYSDFSANRKRMQKVIKAL